MRALAAVLILAACLTRCHAHNAPPKSHERDTLFRHLLTALGVSPDSPLLRAVKCAQTIGPSKCLAALSIWRSEKAAAIFRRKESLASNLLEDVKQFPWEQYTNSSQDEVEEQLCEGTVHLLQYRPLKFSMLPGYEFELASNGNGTLNVDVLSNQPTDQSRGMKKMRQTFYNIVPYLLLPGLLMSAILPFVLPALKMMTVAVGMLNNMALSGAVFTLLRNNAFNDRYEKKVIYVNQGYRNEEYKHHHGNHHHESHHEVPETIYEVYGDKTQHEDHHQSHHEVPETFYKIHGDTTHHEDFQGYESSQVNIVAPETLNTGNFEFIKESPGISPNADWINQYYGNTSPHITFEKKKGNNFRPNNS